MSPKSFLKLRETRATRIFYTGEITVRKLIPLKNQIELGVIWKSTFWSIIPPKGNSKFQDMLVKNGEETMNTATISRLRWLSAFPLVQANSWEHVKSIGVGIFSLARRDQLSKALWKYPSHPLLDSANRGGVACIFITPERSASNEPHAYFVFCAKQIECAARATIQHRWCTQYVCMCSLHNGTEPSLAPCQRAVNAC